jgi:5-formyltetrahydrofolate cyclo-ligase
MIGKEMANRKKAIREKIKEIRFKLSKAEVLSKSTEIQRRFFDLPEFKYVKTVSFYVAKGNEVQTEQMIKDSIKMGKRVLVPITDKKSGRLVFSELRDYDVELELGTFGVLEPREKHRKIAPSTEAELIVVPGVVFDKRGYRLGHGKGYYDKFLREVFSAKTDVPAIGLAYEFQVLEEIPYGHNDIPVHKIVTEKRVIIPEPSPTKRGGK